MGRAAYAAYAAMVIGAVAVFLLVRSRGEMLTAPPPAAAVARSAAPIGGAIPNAGLHVVFAIAVVVALGRLLGTLLTRVRQPPVIGEMMAGILLGPSFAGRFAPRAAAFILPPPVAPLLGVVAQIGVALYMFLIGLELNADRIRSRAHSTIAMSHASIVVPFILGSILALYLYPRLSSSDVTFTSFALFMGVAMSITAFPVLARILTDRGLNDSELGVAALTCAAVDDVTAWCLLALVVGVAQTRPQAASAVAALTAGFVALLLWGVRPFAIRLASRSSRVTGPGIEAGLRAGPGAGVVALVLAGAVLSALATEIIGVHAIFGAFLFGAVVPHDSGVARLLTKRLKGPVTIMLLPAFFALAGMRTRVDLVPGASGWLICLLIILVATVGKAGGTLIAAQLSGIDLRSAASLGILMNTRGLMELVALNIGLDLGVISPPLFTMLVLMALATTVATTPLLDRLLPASCVTIDPLDGRR